MGEIDPTRKLPAELLLQILYNLDARTLVKTSTLSITWNRISRDQALWRQICLEDLSCKQPAIDLDWYGVYKHHARLRRNWTSATSSTFRLPQPQHRSEGHLDAIYAVHMVQDSLVSGGRDMTIRIWDLQTHRLVGKPLVGHSSAVLSLHFEPAAGRDIIVSGGQNGELITWKFSANAMIRSTRRSHESAVVGVKINNDLVITSSKDRSIKIWSLAALSGNDEAHDCVPLRTLNGHVGSVNSIDSFGDILVSASGDNTVKIWSVSKGVEKGSVQEPRSVACVRLCGDKIVCGGRDQSLAVYNSQFEQPEKRLYAHKGLVRAVQTRIGHGLLDLIASGSYDGMVMIWTRTETGDWLPQMLDRSFSTTSQMAHVGEVSRSQGEVATHSTPIFGLDFNARHLVCCSDSPVIDGWDFASGDDEIVAALDGLAAWQ